MEEPYGECTNDYTECNKIYYNALKEIITKNISTSSRNISR